MENKIEYQKLQHLLNTESKDFEFLQKLSADELRTLRVRMTEVMDLDQPEIWGRVAKVAKFMPNFLNAKVSETVLGALITANISTYVPIKDAISIMKNLSTPFLAEVAEYMIPEKSEELIENISVDTLKKITTQLLKNKKYYVASGFVNVLSFPKINAISEVITDELDLILIAEFVENKAHIARIVEGFSDKRILKIIQTAYKNNKQEEILIVFKLLSPRELTRVLSIVKQLSDTEQNTILQDFVTRIK